MVSDFSEIFIRKVKSSVQSPEARSGADTKLWETRRGRWQSKSCIKTSNSKPNTEIQVILTIYSWVSHSEICETMLRERKSLICSLHFEKQTYYPSDFVFHSLLLHRIPVFSAYIAETLMMWTVLKSAFQVGWLKASVWIMPEAPGI